MGLKAGPLLGLDRTIRLSGSEDFLPSGSTPAGWASHRFCHEPVPGTGPENRSAMGSTLGGWDALKSSGAGLSAGGGGRRR
jgi:hypothetical protein